MSTPALTAYYDQARRRVTETIRRYGSRLTYVSDDCACEVCAVTGGWESSFTEEKGPAFCYTTGLFGVGHPELLVYELAYEDSCRLLNLIVHNIRDHNDDLTPGEVIQIERLGMNLLVEEVPNPGEIVYQANDYWGLQRGNSVPVLQLTWADPAGRFPWEPDCAAPASGQPRPSEHSA